MVTRRRIQVRVRYLGGSLKLLSLLSWVSTRPFGRVISLGVQSLNFPPFASVLLSISLNLFSYLLSDLFLLAATRLFEVLLVSDTGCFCFLHPRELLYSLVLLFRLAL